MRRGILVLFAVLLMSIAFTPSMVPAAYWFNFNYSGTGVTSSGTLTTEEISSGIYHIIGISGTRNSFGITSFVAGGPSDFVYNGQAAIDNVLLYPASPAFLSATSHSGFVFGTTDGEFNPYYDPGSGNYYEYKLGGNIPGTLIAFNLTPVPIPAAAWLLGSGLVGLVVVRRRMKK